MATVDQQIDALLKRTKNPAINDRWYVYGAGGRLIAGDLFYKTALGALRKVFPGVHVYSKGVSGGGTVSYAIDQEPRHVFVSRDPDFDLRRKAAANPARKSRKVTLVAANPRKAKSRLTCDEYETQYSKDGKTWNRWNVVCYEDMARKIARDVSRDFPAYSVRVVKL